MAHETIFETGELHKVFGPTVALQRVDLSIRRGEIVGLVGENGSGKSTVMSIAAGMQPPTSGEMRFLSKPWRPGSMVEAQRAGLSMILQEASTIGGVSVSQNLFAGREDEFARAGLVSMRRMHLAADALLDNFSIRNIRGRTPIDALSFEDRKLVEIVRCVSEHTQMLVVDETTTALSHEGRDVLYRLIHRMAAENKAVVFISHDIDEVREHCDALLVLRDGEVTGALDKAALLAPDAARTIRRLMVGREIGERYYREDYDADRRDTVALELRDLCFGPIRHFNLRLHAGEIVGLGGLSGCGMHEIGRLAYGIERPDAGKVLRGGVEIRDCLGAIENGIGYISKNRDSEAIILNASIQENIVLPSLRALSRRTLIKPSAERAMADGQIEAFRIKCGGGAEWVSTLSGGNKQKVSFAKWTAKGAEVLIMDCPTRGVDVGVKQSMYALIERMKREGKAILMVSEELPELIGMADRLIVMKDFRVTKEFPRSPTLTEADVIEHMI